MQAASKKVTSSFKRHSFERKYFSFNEHAPETLVGKVATRGSHRRLSSYSAQLR